MKIFYTVLIVGLSLFVAWAVFAESGGHLDLGGGRLRFSQPANGNRQIIDIRFPDDSATANYTGQLIDFPNPYGARINHVYTEGFNPSRAKADEPAWATSMESRFDPDATTSFAEWHLAYTAPVAAGGWGYRPISVGVNSVNQQAQMYFQGTNVDIRGTDNLVYEGINTATQNHIMIGGMKLLFDTNNAAAIQQKNAAASSYVDMIRLDASDRILLSYAGIAPVRIGGPAELAPVAFGSLGAPIDFTLRGCSDCTIANPCAAGGTGALAKRLNGVWVCN